MVIGEGFDVDPDAFEPSGGDNGPSTPEEELALRVITRLRQDKPKAALAAAEELIIRIKLTLDS
jgi:hypothetical protein